MKSTILISPLTPNTRLKFPGTANKMLLLYQALGLNIGFQLLPTV